MKVFMSTERTAIAAALMLAASLAMAGPNGGTTQGVTQKASGASFSNINLSTDVCAGVSGTLQVTVTGTTNDGGGNDTVWFTVYDDGAEKFAQQINVPVGSTTTTTVTVSYPGKVGGSAPGIALDLGETRGASNLLEVDPFFPTASSGACSTAAPVATPTLSEWSLAMLVALLGGFGIVVARRRKA